MRNGYTKANEVSSNVTDTADQAHLFMFHENIAADEVRKVDDYDYVRSSQPSSVNIGVDVGSEVKHDGGLLNRPESHHQHAISDSTILDLLMRTKQADEGNNTLLSTHNYEARMKAGPSIIPVSENLHPSYASSESELNSRNHPPRQIPPTSRVGVSLPPFERHHIQNSIAHHMRGRQEPQGIWDTSEDRPENLACPLANYSPRSNRHSQQFRNGTPSASTISLPRLDISTNTPVARVTDTLSPYSRPHQSHIMSDSQLSSQNAEMSTLDYQKQLHQQSSIRTRANVLNVNTEYNPDSILNNTSDSSFPPSISVEHTPRSYITQFSFGEQSLGEATDADRDCVAPLQSRSWLDTIQMQRHTSAPYVYRRTRGSSPNIHGPQTLECRRGSSPNIHKPQTRIECRRGSSPNIHTVVSGSDEAVTRLRLQSIELDRSPSICFTESGMRNQFQGERTREMHMQDGMAMLEQILSLNTETRVTIAAGADGQKEDGCLDMQLDSPRIAKPVSMPSLRKKRTTALNSSNSAPVVGPQAPVNDGLGGKQVRWRSERHKGKMHIKFATSSLLGYSRDGTTLVNIDLDSGQKQKAYFPNNAEGERIWLLLAEAFTSGVLFMSADEGDNQDVRLETKLKCAVELKERRTGGITNGAYPDPKYLKRVRIQLENLLSPK